MRMTTLTSNNNKAGWRSEDATQPPYLSCQCAICGTVYDEKTQPLDVEIEYDRWDMKAFCSLSLDDIGFNTETGRPPPLCWGCWGGILRKFADDMRGEKSVDLGVLLRIGEVAELCRCSHRLVWRLIKEGRLQKVMLGPRTARVSSDSVAALVRNDNDK